MTAAKGIRLRQQMKYGLYCSDKAVSLKVKLAGSEQRLPCIVQFPKKGWRHVNPLSHWD